MMVIIGLDVYALADAKQERQPKPERDEIGEKTAGNE